MQASTGRTGAEWAEQARKIEGLGYSTLFMPDHFVDTALAPMVALPFAAAATTTLRIGMLVLGNDYKHPAVVAKEAATLDVLSDGRLEFGLGAGLDDRRLRRARHAATTAPVSASSASPKRSRS